MIDAAETSSSRAPQIVRAVVIGMVLSLVGIGVVLGVLVSAHRGLQVDEVEHVHIVYNMKTGLRPYADFHQAHNPLLWMTLLPAVDVDEPRQSFQRARSITLVYLLAHLAVLALLARRLGGAPAACAALALAVTHTTLLERGMEVRPDGLASLWVSLALLAELDSSRSCTWRHGASALALGLAFCTTNKSVLVCAAFGLLWLVRAWRRRRPALLLAPMGTFALPLAALAAWLVWQGSLAAFWQINFVDAFEVVTRAAPQQRLGVKVDIWQFLLPELRRNAVVSSLLAAGWLWSLAAWRPKGDRSLRFPSVLATFCLVSLWVNPFPYPYFHVMVLPVLLVLAGTFVHRTGTWIASRRLTAGSAATAGWVIILVVQCLASWSTHDRLLAKATDPELLERQMLSLERVEAITEPTDAVFDLVGLYHQPDAYSVFLMTSNAIAKYYVGRFPRMVPQLRDRQMVAAVLNYRTFGLRGEEQKFLQEHLVHLDGNLLVLGTSLRDLAPGQSKTFEVLKEKPFRFDGAGELRVDGEPFVGGVLSRGEHVVERVSGEGGRLVMDVDPGEVLGPPIKLFVGFD